jgi:hypothetical protein
MKLISILISGLLCAVTTSMFAGYKYGDTITIENKFGQVITPGWVVIRESYTGPIISLPHYPTITFMTLTYLKGRSIGDVIDISGISPILAGWVNIGRSGDKGTDQFSYKIRYRIEKQYSADEPGSDELPPVTQRMVEYDFASMDFRNSIRLDGSRRNGPTASEAKAIARAEAERAEAEAKSGARPGTAWAEDKSWTPLSDREDTLPGSSK